MADGRVSAYWARAGGRGDLNCDGEIDGRDIGPLVTAMIDPAGYGGLHECDIQLADINDDGLIDGADVQLLVDALLCS